MRQDPYALIRNASITSQARRNGSAVDLLLVGDSITDFWRFQGREVWKRFEQAGYRPTNAGVAGDRTEHLLWRIDSGELDGVQPKAIVLLIGTNNLGQIHDERPEWAAAGIRKIVSHLHRRMPKARILLLAVFPRSEKDSLMRHRVNELNHLMARWSQSGRAHFLNLDNEFLNSNGELRPGVMLPDKLHLTVKGYQIWYSGMEGALHDMLTAK